MLVRPPGLFRTIWLILYILSITHTYRVSSESEGTLRLVACWVTSTWTWVFVGVVGESLATENFNLFLPWVPCDRLGTKFSFQGCRFNQTPAIGYVAKPNLFFKNLKIYFPNFRFPAKTSEFRRSQIAKSSSNCKVAAFSISFLSACTSVPYRQLSVHRGQFRVSVEYFLQVLQVKTENSSCGPSDSKVRGPLLSYVRITHVKTNLGD